MANHYTEFSFQLEDLTETEIASLRDAEAEVRAQSDDPDCFYSPLQEIDLEEGTAWFASEDTLCPGDTARIVQAFLKRERPGDVVAFTAASRCDRPILDAFGGSGYVVTAAQITSTHLGAGWAEEMEATTEVITCVYCGDVIPPGRDEASPQGSMHPQCAIQHEFENPHEW